MRRPALVLNVVGNCLFLNTHKFLTTDKINADWYISEYGEKLKWDQCLNCELMWWRRKEGKTIITDGAKKGSVMGHFFVSSLGLDFFFSLVVSVKNIIK